MLHCILRTTEVNVSLFKPVQSAVCSTVISTIFLPIWMNTRSCCVCPYNFLIDESDYYRLMVLDTSWHVYSLIDFNWQADQNVIDKISFQQLRFLLFSLRFDYYIFCEIYSTSSWLKNDSIQHYRECLRNSLNLHVHVNVQEWHFPSVPSVKMLPMLKCCVFILTIIAVASSWVDLSIEQHEILKPTNLPLVKRIFSIFSQLWFLPLRHFFAGEIRPFLFCFFATASHRLCGFLRNIVWCEERQRASARNYNNLTKHN